jgi:nucleolar GTP-binding protein
MKNVSKNKLQNNPVVPRTVRKRTLAEMTAELKASGHETVRIEERAKLIAQARNVQTKASKRKRGGDGDEDEEMDVDEDGWESAEGAMDVDDGDDQGGSARKRGKTNSGSVVSKKRIPAMDRTTKGIRDAKVRFVYRFFWERSKSDMVFWDNVLQQGREAARLKQFDQRTRNMYGKAGEADRAIKTKMPKHLFSGEFSSPIFFLFFFFIC